MNKDIIGKLPELKSFGDDLSKKWFIRFSQRDPKDGKLKRIKVSGKMNQYLSVKKRYAEARRLINHYSKLMRTGWSYFEQQETIVVSNDVQVNKYQELRSKNRPFSRYADLWVSRAVERGNVSKISMKSYVGPSRIICEWLESRNLHENDISTLDNKVMQDFFKWAINIKYYSKETIKKYRRVMTNIFDVAIADGVTMENPVFNIPRAKNNKNKASKPFTDEDRELLKRVISVEDPQLWLAIQLLYYCFLRPRKELRLLKVKHINFARGFIEVDAERSKTNRTRNVDIPTPLMGVLLSQGIDKYPSEYYVIGINRVPNTETYGVNNLYCRFMKFVKRLGLDNKGYTFYSWKHTGNSRSVDAGLSIEELQSQNGHTDIQTTQIYLKDRIKIANKNLREKFPEI